MRSLAQTLSDNCTAIAAFLARVFRVYKNYPATGAFSLVAKHACKQTPRNVTYLLGKNSPNQAFDIQFFQCNQRILFHKLGGTLV
jgi:hypothetical protein